jgi:hypothetical protein
VPLKKGSSKQTLAANIRKLVQEGRPLRQAAAIAYQQRKPRTRK